MIVKLSFMKLITNKNIFQSPTKLKYVFCSIYYLSQFNVNKNVWLKLVKVESIVTCW
jgi:hypothetical protein